MIHAHCPEVRQGRVPWTKINCTLGKHLITDKIIQKYVYFDLFHML